MSPDDDPVQPREAQTTAALRAVLNALLPIAAGVVDVQGNALRVGASSAFKDTLADYPQVVVRVVLGRSVIGGGNSLLFFDRTNDVAVHGRSRPGSRILFEVQALSDYERRTVADALTAGIEANYSVQTDGTTIEGAVLDALDGCGVVLGGWEGDQFPDPRLADARPFGQVYRATLTLRCTVSQTWRVPLDSSSASAGVTLTITSPGTPRTPSGVTITTTVPIPPTS